jgi:hypothetical protein
MPLRSRLAAPSAKLMAKLRVSFKAIPSSGCELSPVLLW